MASFGDFNRVNTNVTALSAQLSLNKINSELGDSRLKLSTGKRINSAEDNSAGYAIATKLNSRIKGLEQALQNVSDAKSVLDVVERAYTNILDILIEMKSLTIQGSNQVIEEEERSYIAYTLEGLAEDINDIAETTTFNDIQLLDGEFANKNNSLILSVQAGEGIDNIFDIELKAVNLKTLFTTQNNNDTDDALGAGDGIGDNSVDGLNPHNNGLIPINSDGAAPTGGVGGDSGDAIALSADNIVDFNGNFGANDVNGKRGRLFIHSNPTDPGNHANHNDYRNFIQHLDLALSRLNNNLNELGINQRSLSSKIENLTQAITTNSAAHSRIMDTDFAKEQSNSIKLQILQQTATAALSQANMGPQAVLGFLGQ
jgi:flagellin